ncbi:cyclopropane fatty-acyl-phospholipid synthase-like methyltransferase [Arthrobacter globiformis]|uniref:hypothetical protein n=1 Tax=Arthrobacter globiformis TaxID=1665 RepID=UPI00278AFFB7|nr:hypothetical protein [Arthrobacter globiformis]MDQ1059055.1 cyclopropane fatty-acyl-phospholipid synthase-like methyltransferase [Arthrobacter globiformis]
MHGVDHQPTLLRVLWDGKKTEQHTTLRVRERRGMGDHCAATLRLWEEGFLQRAAEMRELGFDEVFQRVSRSAFA